MRKILKSPFDLVADVLELKIELIDKNSAMGKTPKWDSLNHISIIGEIEKNYGITVPDDEIDKYTTMKAIIDVYNKQSGNFGLLQGVIEAIKKNPIRRIFHK